MGALTLAASVSAAQFSAALDPEEYAAAGLGKLSVEERQALDRLVDAHRAAEVESAKKEAAVAKQESEAATGERTSLLNRLKVVLTPGTDIEYASVETELVGNFRGYEPGKVLQLANGQQWKVVEGSYWSPAKAAAKPRKVVIEPGVLGSFFLRIEDGGRPRVKILSDAKLKPENSRDN
jgi:hypothetical protein